MSARTDVGKSWTEVDARTRRSSAAAGAFVLSSSSQAFMPRGVATPPSPSMFAARLRDRYSVALSLVLPNRKRTGRASFFAIDEESPEVSRILYNPVHTEYAGTRVNVKARALFAPDSIDGSAESGFTADNIISDRAHIMKKTAFILKDYVGIGDLCAILVRFMF